MNQPVSSDPESSFQVRHEGKTLRAFMRPSAPYYGHHVELYDLGLDRSETHAIERDGRLHYAPGPTVGPALWSSGA